MILATTLALYQLQLFTSPAFSFFTELHPYALLMYLKGRADSGNGAHYSSMLPLTLKAINSHLTVHSAHYSMNTLVASPLDFPQMNQGVRQRV